MQYFYNGTRPLWPYSFNLYVSDVNFFRFNWHSDFEFILLLSGCISLRTRSDIFTLNEGDVFLLNSNCGHTWLSERTDATALIMHFSPEYFSCLEPSFEKLEIQCVSTPQSRNEPRFTRLRCLAAQMMLAESSQEPAARFILRGAFTMLLGYLLSEFPFTNSNELESPHDHKNLKTIQTVLDWLERNYDRKITLEEAAKVARY
ncbi:MAG: AraC family ligand binding domain-containing protein, partial [Pyramidobacter sp.]|nr:AraC family ligand binding domain-containing protein [Pyramidobacter sp.]